MSDAPETPTRRSVLSAAAAAGAGLGLAATAAAWTASLAPVVRYEPPTRRKIGTPKQYPPGVRFLPEEKIFVERVGNRFRALSAVCTHLGCTVNREGEKGYHCPCHGSTFGPDGGKVAGPAPRGLPWRPLEQLADGTIVVDLAAEVGPDRGLDAKEPS